MPINEMKGAFFPMSEEGFILNPTDATHIPSALIPLIKEAVSLFQEYEHKDLHAVLLRGSTPRGLYTAELSDIDLFALVCRPDIRWQSADWAHEANARIKEKYGVNIEIEWNLSSWYPDFYNHNPRLAFFIKTQSLHLWGDNIQTSLPEFKISEDLKMNLTWLEEDYLAFQKQVNTFSCKKQAVPAALLRPFLKVLIRSAFETVMMREGRYTPDLPLCAHTFVKYYPNAQKPLHELLQCFSQDFSETKSLKENTGKVFEIIKNVITKKPPSSKKY